MIQAVEDMVIIDPIHEDKIGLIYVPDQYKKYNAKFHGVVVAVGPDYPDDLKKGDKVAYVRHEGFEINEGKHLAVRERWIVGKICEQE